MPALLRTVSHVPFFMEIISVVPRVNWRELVAEYRTTQAKVA